jgi:hypothetical protein
MMKFKITYISPPISEMPKTAHIEAKSKALAVGKLFASFPFVEEIINIEEL